MKHSRNPSFPPPTTRLLRGLALALVWLGASGAGASAAEVEAEACAQQLARRVQARYEAVLDIEARFVQTSRSVVFGSGGLGGDQRSEGHVVFAKPGRMRWHYTAPQESLVISDGKTLWLVDPVAREAQRMPVSEGFLSGAALSFLVGEGDLLAEFTVSAPQGACSEEFADLVLVPRRPASYEQLEIRARVESGDVAASTVIDLFGNRTLVEFQEMKVDRKPSAERFTYRPPEGVRVTDLAPPGAGP